MVKRHENFAVLMNYDYIITKAFQNRIGTDQSAFDKGDFDVAVKHRKQFIRSLTNVLTFIFHFPIGQGAFGDRARMELAGRFFPIPPDDRDFTYLHGMSTHG